jgi:hypothetical protein
MSTAANAVTAILRPQGRCVLLLALLTTLSGACSEAGHSGHLAEHFFPLEAGLNWHYRVQRTTMDGRAEMRYAIQSVAPPVDSDISAVRETLSGYRYLYAVNDEGIFRIGEHASTQPATLDAGTRELVLPQPLLTTSRWQTTSRTSVLESSASPWESLFRVNVPVTLHYVVESLDAEVVTGAGRFTNCLVIAGQGGVDADIGDYIGQTQIAVVSREWFAPGVGLVRMERHETTAAESLNSGSLTMELDSWAGR